MKTHTFKPTMTRCSFVIAFLTAAHLVAQTPPQVTGTPATEFTDSNLPIVVIDTYGQEIVDEVRIPAHMGVIDNGTGRRNHYPSDPFNDYDGRIAIELRGSATQMYPKKQYRFETQDSTGEDLNVPLLGLPKENDWIFYGPYDDKSLIRNILAYKLSNDMGRYASRTRCCELVLNGDYRGLYVLMEKIKRDKNRVDISRMDTNDTAGDSLTGGYIIKIDKLSGENVGGWSSSAGIYYQYHYPKANAIVPEQMDYIRNFMDTFEAVMASAGFADPINGYARYIDVDSFVDHFLINEACKNVDAYRISAFLYKDRNSKGGKLVAGPIWDFNLSFGEAWFPEDLYLTRGWQVDYNTHRPWDEFKVPFWWIKLSRDPSFVTRLVTRWQSLRNGLLQKEALYHTIDLLVDSLAEARTRNFARWPAAGSDRSHLNEVRVMKEWISRRFDWIDRHLKDLAEGRPASEGDGVPDRFVLEQNYPNPFNAATKIRFGLPLVARVKIELFNVSGQMLLRLLDSREETGYHTLEFRASDLPSGVYLYRLQTDYFEDVKKMTLLR